MIALLIFPFFYLKEIVFGALYVACDVLTPKSRIQPVLLRVPIGLPSERKRLLLASLISMTPGTISVREEEGGHILVVHSLYGGHDPKATLAQIKARYESVVARLPF